MLLTADKKATRINPLCINVDEPICIFPLRTVVSVRLAKGVPLGAH